jgi:hypothetical protein
MWFSVVESQACHQLVQAGIAQAIVVMFCVLGLFLAIVFEFCSSGCGEHQSNSI